MRAFCTVSAPLEVCASSAEQLSPGSRFLALRLLGNQQPKTLYFLVDAKSRVREVYTQTCLHFATQGMLDTELFGLAVLIDGEYMFADPESKLSKYGPKSWRSSHTHGLDANGRPLLELHFRVQFYIESPFMLKDETSRHNYYLQLKYNALYREVPKGYSEQSMVLLAGLALQADLGDAPTTPAPTPATITAAASTKSITTGKDHVESEECNDEDKLNIASDKSVEGASTTTSKAYKATITTTLPKISKRSNEGLAPRLSIYDTAATAAAAASQTSNSKTETTKATTTARALDTAGARHPSSAASSTSSVFQINSNRKRGFLLKTTTQSATPTTALTASAAHQNAEYFRLEDYLPTGLRTAWAASALRACHRENQGMSAADAKLHYVQQACVVHESINAHTFRMRMAKSESGPGQSLFVVYAKGIKVFGVGVGDNPPQQITFLWPNITKLSFERKKFEIRSGDSKITLYASSDEKNKMLLTLCKETHQFSMKIAARLKEVIKREEEESNCLHACYSYSRSLQLPPYKNKSDQRISVISSTSSNTTSGIVSDRVHSEDELEIMINTPPAPIPAPSTESLALAHLLDHPSVSRQTSSVGQVSLKELEEQLAALSVHQAQLQQQQQLRMSGGSSGGGASPTELSHTSVGNSSSGSGSQPTSSQRNADSSTATDSPSSQHNIGSQCSSTCSTVVVTSTTEASVNALGSLSVHGSVSGSINPATAGSGSSAQRRNSTSSSLELGFSHTAQNSTLSEQESTCIDHDFESVARINSRIGSGGVEDAESVSGVYTLAHSPPTETSGVYTMHSSELTGQSSEMAESEKSSHYGIFQPTSAKSDLHEETPLRKAHSGLMDSVDGDANYHGKRIKSEQFRLRSDSNISASGSFRGDGSDPTDNKHTLLTAEELTDLIVGVGRGTYPNRKTISSTLDSDCDYVTLPLPLSLAGESYIKGHQDTAPTEDQVADLMSDLLPTDPPAPPQRIDSNGLKCNAPHLASSKMVRMGSPPPYNARHEKTGLCGPPVRSSLPSKLSAANNTSSKSTSAATKMQDVKATSKNSTKEAKLALKAAMPLPLPLPLSTPPPTAAIRRRDPPPYPSGATKQRPTSLISASSSSSCNHAQHALPHIGGSMTSLKSEEVTARFITTRPQINILKAHTSLVNESARPSYAAPTYCSSAASSTGSTISSHHHHQHHTPGHLSQHSVVQYASGSQPSLSLSHHHSAAQAVGTSAVMSAAAMAHAAAAAAAGAGVIPSSIGIPIVPYTLHSAHKSMSSLQHQHQHQQPPPPPPPYPDLKPQPRTCVLLPVIKPQQFLPPPPPSLPRQPPPPPPQLASVYGSQLARKQLELYQQQLYSDVDYVIYPIQDPAVSQQEYLDAKQGSLMAAMAQTPPPPPPHPYLAYHHTAQAHASAWDTYKGHAIYRSTPYLPLALSAHSRYASTQNLSDTYVQLPSTYSPLYSPSMASLCSSYEPPPPPPLHPAALASAAAVGTPNLFARSRSDDNILNSFDSLPKMKRQPPPPPPPPYVNRRLKKPPMPAPTEKPPPIPSKPPGNNSSISTHSISHMPARIQLPPRKPLTLAATRNGHSHMIKTSSGAQWAGERPKLDSGLSRGSSSILAHLQASVAAANRSAGLKHTSASLNSNSAMATTTTIGASTSASAIAAANALDIALLREKSRNLDLPLISALCNDRSLIKQTKVLVNPKNAQNSLNNGNGSATLCPPFKANNASTTQSAGTATVAATSVPGTATINPTATTPATATSSSIVNGNHTSSKSLSTTTATTANLNGTTTTTGAATSTPAAVNTNTNANAANPVNKYPAASKPRKTSVSHRHPNDKLPPLPMQLAEANNYVMDPAMQKHHHKSYNSQT